MEITRIDELDEYKFDTTEETYIISPPDSNHFAEGICYEFEFDHVTGKWWILPNTGGCIVVDEPELRHFIKTLLKNEWVFWFGGW